MSRRPKARPARSPTPSFGEAPIDRPARPRFLVVAAVTCGVVSFLVYVATLSPTVAGGDSGELITVAHVLGVAHPPGYPLYTMLARLFTLLPVSTIAWRANLLSASCDAGAAFLLCGAVGRWAGSVWSGVLAGGAFAFSPLIWPYAVTAEVFPLNNLFAAGLIDLSVRATLEPRPWVLPLAAFWLGLGLTNHHTLVFLGLPFALYLLYLERGRAPAPRALILPSMAFALGLLPYLYLPLAASWDPPVLWGDPTSWRGFLTHFFRHEYGTFRLASQEVGGEVALVPRLLLFWRRFASTTYGMGPALLLAAVVSLLRRTPARRLGVLWTTALLFYLTVFSALSNVRLDDPLHVTVQERFWQQGLVVACALAGVGLAAVARGLRGTLRAVEPLLALGLPAVLLVLHFGAMDHRDRRFFRDYGAAILESLPSGALLLIMSDEAVGSVRYLQEVEGLRRDVRVIVTGQLTSPWFRKLAARQVPSVTLPPEGFTARQFVDANLGRIPIFIVNKVPWLQTLEEAYKPWPMGLADQVLPRETRPDPARWVETASSSFRRFDPAEAARSPEGSWERYTADNYWKQCRRFAVSLATAAAARREDPTLPRLIIPALEALAERDPSPEPTLFKNLGVAYQLLSRTDPAAVEGMVRHWRRYLATNPRNDPDREAIRTLVEQAARAGT